jgi:phosphogluconate dehydratase
MPELHKLTPYLGVLQNRGFKVALLTDGRMSGASGKVLAAIQATPEAVDGGAIGKIRDGDIVSIDAEQGELMVTGQDDDFADRQVADVDRSANHAGLGRELFAAFRERVSGAEQGASSIGGGVS